MTEEEKDAIEIYEEDIRIAREYYENEEDFKADGEYNKVILLNLIEKLQKENRKLKQEQAKRNWIRVKENGEVVPMFYISKDKIREKLKEKQERAKKYYEKRGIFHNCNLCNNTCNWYKFCITYKELLEEK